MGVDNPDLGEQPSFVEDFLTRLDIDRDQLLEVLEQIDEQLADHEESLVVEVAEETYADAYWDTDVDRDRDRRHDFFVVYVERDVEALQAAMPGSVFDRFEPGDETHDLYVGGVVVRFVTGRSHAVVRLFETEFEYLDIGVPTEESVYQAWADAVDKG